MSRYWLLLIPLVLAAAAPVNGAAQTFPRPAPAPGSPPATSAVPAARPDPARVAPYHQSLRMVMVEGGREREIGTLEDQVVLADDNGQPSVIRVQNLDGPGGAMTDTAVADPASLAPRWHSSHAEHRRLRLEFNRGKVTGSFKGSGDPPFPIDQAVAENIFDSNMLDVLVCALPLAHGYRGRMTVYLYEAGGAVPVDVAVTGSETVGGQDTWITGVTLAGRTARYFIGKSDHRVAQIISTQGPGVELRVVRQ